MSDYDNTNSGALYVNKKKERENQPDRTGSAEVCCPSCGVVTEFWVSAWLKKAGAQSKIAGQSFVSLAFTAKDEKPPHPNNVNGGPDDDDIPF